MEETQKRAIGVNGGDGGAYFTPKFEVIRDAPRWRCTGCGSAKLDIFREQGKDPKIARIGLVCGVCEAVSYFTMEEWEKALEI